METGDIIFWVISVAFAGLAGAWLLRSAARPPGAGSGDTGLAVYKAQLAELDRDLARAVIPADEAERLRAEIGRRLLAADRQRAAAAAAGDGPALVTAIVGVALASAFGLYAWLGAPGYPDVPHAARISEAERLRASRPSQDEALAEQPPAPVADPEDPEMAGLIRQLRAAVAARPDDIEGHRLLASNEAALGNTAAAAEAQARVVALLGSAATAADQAILADALILAARGYVSPEAEAAILAALDLDPRNGTAQFYLGLLEAQTGRPDRAFAIWRSLLESSPPEAPWVPVIRDRLPLLAEAAGVDYSPPPAAPGPSAGDVAAAEEMAPADRDAMIRGMVDQLAARIDAEGGSPDEWARLVTSLAVLGDTARAAETWARAQDHFAADPGGLETVAAAARAAGVAE